MQKGNTDHAETAAVVQCKHSQKYICPFSSVKITALIILNMTDAFDGYIRAIVFHNNHLVPMFIINLCDEVP